MLNNNLDNNNAQGNIQNNGSIPTVNPVGNLENVSSQPVDNTIVSNNNSVPTVNPANNLGNIPPQSVNNFVGNSNPTSNNLVNRIDNAFLQTGNVVNNTSSSQEQNTNLENQKKVDIEYTSPSKGKMIFLAFAFIILLAFIIFLPEITSMINLYKSGAYNKVEEKITTGSMMCSLKTNTASLDKNYDLSFRFKDNKLVKTDFVITTKGNPTEDEETLNNVASICNQLKDDLSGADGIYIRCEYSTGKLIEKQTFDLANVDLSSLNAAFSEAGGNYPEYQYGQDIDLIERSMKSSGYTCTRQK